jgi:hypothetical protein
VGAPTVTQRLAGGVSLFSVPKHRAFRVAVAMMQALCGAHPWPSSSDGDIVPAMGRWLLAYRVSFLASWSVALFLAACTDSHTGTLVIPVQERVDDGVVYHLTAMLHVLSVDYATNEQDNVDLNSAGRSAPFELDRPALPFLTWVVMDPGWTLEMSIDRGATFEVVAATRLTDGRAGNPLLLIISENQTTTAGFKFQVHAADGDRTVTIGTP